MKILLDTNILVYAAKKRFDLFGKIKEKFPSAEIVVPNLVIGELEKLSKEAKKGSNKRAAKLALQILQFSKVKIVGLGGGHTDEEIARWAKEHRAIVGTHDKEFKKKLRQAGIPLLTL